jgi:hypothetical protein
MNLDLSRNDDIHLVGRITVSENHVPGRQFDGGSSCLG